MATTTGVASRSSLSSMSPERLQQLQELASNTMRSRAPDVGIEDPRQVVQGMTGVPGQTLEVPPSALQEEVAGVPRLSTEAVPTDVNGVPFTSDSIQTPEDLAVSTGSQFAGRQVFEPMLDENQQPMLDENGEPMVRPVSMENYQDQRSIERARGLEVGQDINQLASQPYEYAKPFVKDVASKQKETQFDESGRVAARSLADRDDLDIYSDTAATTIGSLVSTANNYLFNNSPIKVDVGAGMVTAGVAVAAEMGLDFENRTQLNTLNTIMALSMAKGVDQARRPDPEKGMPKYSQAFDDGTLMLDQINAVKVAAQNAFKRAGIDIQPRQIEMMSKAMVYGALYDGTMAVVPSETGRPIVYADHSLKNSVDKIKEITAIVAGDQTRSRSSVTPARSGGSFTKPGQQLTAKSLSVPGLITEVAELTKDILGSIGTVFRAKDISYSQAELSLVTSPEYVTREKGTGQFLYSTHPLAKRIGLSRSDYNVAMDKVAPPQGFNPIDTEQMAKYTRDKDKQAAEVMDMKYKTKLYSIENAMSSPGIRYSSWKHSVFNQRFFPNNFDTDYMGDKTGVRDMIGLAAQDFVTGASLFDEGRVRALQDKAVKILKMPGEEQSKALSQLSATELGAIGTMINAVVNYYSAVDGSNPEITSQAPAVLVSMYTPAIGNKLAEVGKRYNDFLQDPQSITMDEDLLSLLAGMEKGESMGSKNLWDDMFNAQTNFKTPNMENKGFALTHQSFDDGNQNGIFLQALFFGGENANDSAQRLGTYNASLDDMRVRGMNIMVSNLDNALRDNEKAQSSFKSFFKEIIEKFGKNTVAKDFFKAPLMQTSYGKDASMYGDLMIELILDNENYKEYADKYLIENNSFNTVYDAAETLATSVESTLRELINTKDSRMMKSIGRYLSVLNTLVMVPGISGDTSIFTPVNTQPVNKYSATNVPVTKIKLSNGKEALIRQRDLEQETIETPEGDLGVGISEQQFAPSFAKPGKLYYNRAKNTYDEFNNVKGSAQGRSTVVGPIQSIDGDLVKWTTVYLNKDRKVPLPALWVHDSIISTPGAGLIYRNAYNNVAIPKAIPEIAKFGNKFKKLIKEAEAEEIKRVKLNGSPVGIGDFGEYAALGALFDEMFDKIDPDNTSFKDMFINRNKGNVSAYDKYVKKTKAMLKEAEDNGWVPDDRIALSDKRSLAVTPKQFENLINLAGDYLKISGPENRLNSWADSFASNVKKTATNLFEAAYYDGNGIGQMTYGATGNRANVSDFVEKVEGERTQNFIDQYQRAYPEE